MAGVNDVAVSGSERVGAVGAGSARSDERHQWPVWRHRQVRLHLAPFGQKDIPTRAIWDVSYRDVEPAAVDRLPRDERPPAWRAGHRPQSSRLGARQVGEKRGRGEVTVDRRRPASRTMTRELAARRARGRGGAARPRPARSTRARHLATFRSAATSPMRSIRHGSRSAQSWVATPKTYVEFEGRTAYGERSQIPFHVTSLDWLESDRVLAGIMTGVWIADRSRAGWRLRRVRWRDAHGVHEAAHRRHVQRREHARVGHDLGARHARRWSSRTATRCQRERDHREGSAESQPMACSRSAIRAGTAAKKSTRASSSRGGRSPICATRSSSTTIRSRDSSPASITSTASTRRRSASAG